MSFSLERSGLAVVHLLRSAVILLHGLISWALLSSLFDLLSSPRDHSSRPPRPSQKAIKDSLHVSTYADLILYSKSSSHEDDRVGSETCAVCLNEMDPRDEVRELRNCSHVFHRGCLDRWLDHDEHGTCPLCRAPLLHLQGSTALPDPPAELNWAVDRLLYLFGDDLMLTVPSTL